MVNIREPVANSLDVAKQAAGKEVAEADEEVHQQAGHADPVGGGGGGGGTELHEVQAQAHDILT